MDYVKVKSKCGTFELCVKPDFFEKNKDLKIEETEFYDVITKNGIIQYLHNPNGPALVNSKTGNTLFFINGSPLSEEDRNKMQHNIGFNDNLKTILTEEEK